MKPLIIFIICLVTICCVFGLNDHLHYDGFKDAAESIQGSFNVIIDDISAISCFGFAIENFSTGVPARLYFYENEVYMRFGNNEERFVFSSPEQADKIVRVLKPLTLGFNYNGNFFDKVITVVNAILFWIGVLVTILLFLITILFDFVGVAWSLIRAIFYLIGVGTLQPRGGGL